MGLAAMNLILWTPIFTCERFKLTGPRCSILLLTHNTSLLARMVTNFPAALWLIYHSFVEHPVSLEVLIVLVNPFESFMVDVSVHLRLRIIFFYWHVLFYNIEAPLQIIYIFITIFYLLDERLKLFST